MCIGKPIYECVTAPASIVTRLFTARLRVGLGFSPTSTSCSIAFLF